MVACAVGVAQELSHHSICRSVFRLHSVTKKRPTSTNRPTSTKRPTHQTNHQRTNERTNQSVRQAKLVLRQNTGTQPNRVLERCRRVLSSRKVSQSGQRGQRAAARRSVGGETKRQRRCRGDSFIHPTISHSLTVTHARRFTLPLTHSLTHSLTHLPLTQPTPPHQQSMTSGPFVKVIGSFYKGTFPTLPHIVQVSGSTKSHSHPSSHTSVAKCTLRV